jgi:acyl carrier protein
MRETLHRLVANTASALAEAEGKGPLAPGAILFGADGVFDSIELVSLIVSIEQALEVEAGLTLVLADERAMSQRKSPFRSVDALVEHIEALRVEAQSDAA